MNFELLSAWSLCFCACDVFMLTSFFQSMFKRRVSVKRSAAYFVIATMVIFAENAFGSTALNLLSVPLVYLLYSIATFSISINCAIVYALIYYIIFAGGREVAFELLYRLVPMVTPFDIPPWFTPYGIPYLVVEYVLAFLFLLFIERFTSKLEVNGDDKFCWYLLVMPLASLEILISYTYMEFPKTGFIAFIMCCAAFLLYFSNAAIFVILEKFTQVMNQNKLMQLSSLKIDMESTNYKNIDKANFIYRRHLHDMHTYFNQFRNLAIRGEDRIIIRIIDELEGKLQAEESDIIYSGDAVVNGLLAEYRGRARELGAEMEISLENHLYLGFISDGDKISMFGNLLLNALEAVEKCRDGERRIDVGMYMGNAYFLVFRVENSYAAGNSGPKDAYGPEGGLMTTKKDAGNHGLGIKIVEELAQKYGGTLEIKTHEAVFVATLMVSSYQNDG